MKKKVYFLGLLLCFCGSLAASERNPKMNYARVFDQGDLYKKYAPLLAHWGCYENALGVAPDCSDQVSPEELQKMEASFHSDCLKRIASEEAAMYKRPMQRNLVTVIGYFGFKFLFEGMRKYFDYVEEELHYDKEEESSDLAGGSSSRAALKVIDFGKGLNQYSNEAETKMAVKSTGSFLESLFDYFFPPARGCLILCL